MEIMAKDKFICTHSSPAYDKHGNSVNDALPERMLHCKCGQNVICPLCGQGHCVVPCHCDGNMYLEDK